MNAVDKSIIHICLICALFTSAGICMENDGLLLKSSSMSINHQRQNSSTRSVEIYIDGTMILEVKKNAYTWDTKKTERTSGRIEILITKDELMNVRKAIAKATGTTIINTEGIDPPDFSNRSSLAVYKNKKKYEYSIKTTGKYSAALTTIINQINELMLKYNLTEKLILKSDTQ